MAQDRVIFHIDCNAFYASVEETLHPEYKKVPMAVCGNPESRRGIILAKNELAKGFGVKTAETIWQAKQKCPDLVLAPARHHLYRQYSEQVNAIYEEYTDQVERFGIDESYLDVTGSIPLFGGDAVKLAHEIRERIPRELGLTVSVGISFNKTFAKVASDMKKPNAVSIISRENFRDVLWPMPVSVLMMVGKSTQAALESMYIHTVGDLANASEKTIGRRLGKIGEQLHHVANGLDDSPVLGIHDKQEVHSVGNGITFKRNLVGEDDIRTAVVALSDTVCARLRKAGLKCRSVQVTIKDPDFKVITRQKQLAHPVWLMPDLAREAMELILASWNVQNPIRLITVTAQKLIGAGEEIEQISFFETETGDKQKQENLAKAVDAVRGKFGSRSISPGRILKNDLGINEDYGEDD